MLLEDWNDVDVDYHGGSPVGKADIDLGLEGQRGRRKERAWDVPPG